MKEFGPRERGLASLAPLGSANAFLRAKIKQKSDGISSINNQAAIKDINYR